MSSTNKKIIFSDTEKDYLIDCYQSRPILWDYTTDGNKKKDQKGLAIGDIIRDMSNAFNKEFRGFSNIKFKNFIIYF